MARLNLTKCLVISPRVRPSHHVRRHLDEIQSHQESHQHGCALDDLVKSSASSRWSSLYCPTRNLSERTIRKTHSSVFAKNKMPITDKSQRKSSVEPNENADHLQILSIYSKDRRILRKIALNVFTEKISKIIL